MPYSFLRDPLLKFVEDKWSSFKNLQEHGQALEDQLFIDQNLGLTPIKALIRELGITEEEFREKYIIPWRALSQQQLKQMLRYWNWAHRFYFGQELILKPVTEINALHWTIIHVAKLNLPGLVVFEKPATFFETQAADTPIDIISRLFQADIHCMPVNQCFYCGRYKEDPRGKPFGNKLSYCHQSGCIPYSQTLPEHQDDCCFKQWNLQKDALKRTLKNQKNHPEKRIKTFLEFCEKRFQANLLIQNHPQPAAEKPENWKFMWSDLESKRTRLSD